MLIAIIAQSGALVVVVSLLLQHFRREQRAASRRVDLLVNQVCALAGKPWQTPPAQSERDEVPTQEPGRFVTAPEQWPDEEPWQI